LYKKGRNTLAVFRPTSTYENNPFGKGININSKAMPIAQNLNLNGKLCLLSNSLFLDVEFPPIVWEFFTQFGNMWNGIYYVK